MPEEMEKSSVISNSDLSSWLFDDLLHRLKITREPLEDKWHRNHAAYACDAEADPKGAWKRGDGENPFSSDTVFDITRQKVNTAHDILMDTGFKNNTIPLGVEVANIPDNDEILAAEEAAATQSVAQPQSQPAPAPTPAPAPAPAPTPAPTMPAEVDDQGMPVEQPMEVDEQEMPLEQPVTETVEVAVAPYSAEACERRIRYQMQMTDAVQAFSAMCFVGVKYGEMWLKKRAGIFDLPPKPYQNANGTWLLKKKEMKSIFIEHKNVWQMYRDLECRDPLKGPIVEVNDVSISDLFDMKGKTPLIQNDAIDRIAARQRGKDVENSQGESSGDENEISPELRGMAQKAKGLKLYEFWCKVPVEHLNRYEEEKKKVVSSNTPSILDVSGKRDEAFVLVVSDGIQHEVIAYKRNPGDKPYKWERLDENPEELGGQGIADRVEPQQRTLNGAIRSFENNVKGLSTLILAVKERHIKGNIKEAFRDGGVLRLTDEAENVRDAVQQFIMQDVTTPLLKLIQLFLEFADYSSGVPRIQQGVQPEGARTAFELQQRLQSSGRLFGDIFMRVDRQIVWAAEQYFLYNLKRDEFPECKGPFIIKALGYLSYTNMLQRMQAIIQYLQLMSADPELAKQINKRWIAEQLADSMDIDKDKVLLSVTEIALTQRAAQANPQTQMQLQSMELQVQTLAAQLEKLQAETQKVQAESAEIIAGVDIKKQELELAQAEILLKAQQGAKTTNERKKEQ